MIVMGFDPGLTGAIAVLKDGNLTDVHDMPVTAKSHGKGNEVNARLLADIVNGVAASTLNLVFACERVGAMRRRKNGKDQSQGASSMFSFGRSTGVIEGVCGVYGHPMHFVRPMVWKKHFGLVKKDKDASRGVAIGLFPESAEYLTRKKDHGRADAILIAAYVSSTL